MSRPLQIIDRSEGSAAILTEFECVGGILFSVEIKDTDRNGSLCRVIYGDGEPDGLPLSRLAFYDARLVP